LNFNHPPKYRNPDSHNIRKAYGARPESNLVVWRKLEGGQRMISKLSKSPGLPLIGLIQQRPEGSTVDMQLVKEQTGPAQGGL
jgi:hypothetical protein